jgi:ABC-type oligopeptide transport system substrate-binding subunit
LIVELEEPAGYFLQLLGHYATYPVPRHAVEAHGDAWTEVRNIVTNGPFRLKAWHRGEVLVLERNPRYSRRARGNLQQIELVVLSDPEAKLKAYEADRLDIMDMIFFPPAEIDRARRHHTEEYVSGPKLFPSYAAFCLGRTPFDDRRVRQAFALAADKENLAGVTRGYCSPAAGGLVPPQMAGHTPVMGPSYDPAGARELLADAGFPGGRGFPVMTLMTHLDPLSRVAGKHLQGQWRNVLGVETRLEAVEWEEYLTRLQTAPPPAVLWGWMADYPDPDNLLRVGMGHVLPYTRWENADYWALVERARRLTDQKTRMELYRKADRILVEEGPILPLAYARSHLLVKSRVRRLVVSPIGYCFWKEVIVEPH